ncbi:DUF3375 domain-containing protein [Microbacterium gorillae]|uniref:DUF3375 domain-containing protein n=1 Tax=Microbacterium gorillae TaxID=1231063 RepID=UPI003D96114B
MSDITAELARISAATQSPTLRLLRTKRAPFVLTVFREVFDQSAKSVKADRVHVRVDAFLAEAREGGYDVPQGDGRSLCTAWMNARWINRVHDDDNDEAYELTSAALGAQRVVESLTADRALLSESRLTMIVDGVRRLAGEANPDRDARITALDKEIAALTAERNRLQAGGELHRAGDGRMLEGYLNMRDLLGQLPRDFRRVEESLDAMRRDLIKQFRAEDRPKGEVLEEYLNRSAQLSQETEEGRAFEGALAILNDRELLRAFQDDLATILDHPFAGEVRAEDARVFRRSTDVLRRGLRDVQHTRTRLHRVLGEHITSHDSAQDREVTRLLAALHDELSVWMDTARVRDTVPALWEQPGRLDVDHVKENFHSPAHDRPVARLDPDAGEAPEGPDFADVRLQGGPLTAEVRAALAEGLADGAATIGEAFNTLPADLSRPVELFGLMQMTADLGRDDDTETVRTHRPDGTPQTFAIPRITADASALHAEEDA